MLNFDLYAIYTEKNERDGSIDELFTSFDEAIQHRMKYANWYRPHGCVWIQRIPANTRFTTAEQWLIDTDGAIISHYKR